MTVLRDTLRDVVASSLRALIVLGTLAVLTLTAWICAVVGAILLLTPIAGRGGAFLIAGGGSVALILVAIGVIVLTQPPDDPPPKPSPAPLGGLAMAAVTAISRGGGPRVALAVGAAILAGVAVLLPGGAREDDTGDGPSRE